MRTLTLILLLGFLPAFLIAQNNYCQPKGGSPCNFQWIETFSCNNVLQNDGYCDREDNDETAPGFNPDGYSDYSDFVVIFTPGQVTTAVLTVDGNVFDEISGWIDWDNSGTFDTDEIITFRGESTVVNEMTAVITVPSDAVQDSVILGGFRIKQDFLEPITDPCADIGNGEIEDYSFIVTNSGTTDGGANDYCSARGDSPCNFQWIETFTCKNVIQDDGYCDREDNDETAPDFDPDGYSDYSDFTVIFAPGEVVTATLTVDGNVFDEISGWLDWDNSGTWDNDEIITFRGESTVVNEMTAIITVPQDAVEGVHIIGGFRIKQDFLEPITDPCADIGNGEIEDYSFIVIPPDNIGCASSFIPQDSTQNICTSTQLSWGAVSGASSYQLLVLDSSGDTIDSKQVSDTNLFVTGLRASEAYKWIVKPIDDQGRKSFGCDTLTFFTADAADPTVSFSPDSVDVCEGRPLVLNPTITGGGTLSYNWSGDLSLLSDPAVDNPVFNSELPEFFKYSLQVSNQYGCSNSDSLVVQVFEKGKVVNASVNSREICFGEDLILTLDFEADSLNFLKQSQNGMEDVSPLNQLGDQYIFNDVDTVIYGVELFANGCADTAWLDTVVFLPQLEIPEIIFENPDSLGPCPGEDYLIRVNNYTDFLSWSNGASGDSIFVNETTNLTVTYDDGCVISTDTSFTFDEVPNTILLAIDRSPALLCEGDSIEVSHGIGIDGFVWYDGDDSSLSKWVKDTTLIYVDFISDRGCVKVSDSVQFNFKPFPEQAQISSLLPLDSLCEGDVTELVSTDSIYDLLWNTGASTPSILVSDSGKYWLESFNGNCKTISDTLRVDFGVIPPQSSISQVVSGEDSLISFHVADHYDWYAEGQLLTFDERIIPFVNEVTYTVQLRSSRGCLGPMSESFFKNATSISEFQEYGFVIYKEAGRSKVKNQRPFEASLYTIDGRLIKKLGSTFVFEWDNQGPVLLSLTLVNGKQVVLKVD
ncbi:GEVED domain-containing protein [Luteibaculum oceani]|uniref:GEVED domain-containing protein n=1 Tax=Luteibaculum oceani TaxID=1294296 RepID=A0A5C6V0U0_9FLAO|nr:GEVED domain-containing protein [Luteibaculum oceani]TXC78789.1 hypothetical protein FRX97_06125 [Luteibaculum oceani]